VTDRPPVTRLLAELAAGVDVARLPPEVVHAAKRCLLDWLGVALAGSADPSAASVRETAAVVAPEPAAWVVGSPVRVGVLLAAVANGVAAHVYDYDDTFNPGHTTVHGSAPVWPAVLAAAELTPTDGRTALAAFVGGFEVACRVGLAAGREHYDAGWHVTGTVGHLGAAAAAGRVLGLPADAMVAALGTGATQAAGLKNVYGSMGKSLHPGKAASDGVLAAVLTRSGFTSSADVVEGRRGFLDVLTPNPAPQRAVDGLGERWLLLEDGFKAYACGSLTHPCIDGVLQLRAEHGLTADDVARVDLDVHEYVISTTGRTAPTTGLEGKFSVYHCVAVALVDGAARLRQFTDERVLAPDVLAARARVTVHEDAAQSKDSAVVRLTLHDGRLLSAAVAHNRGTPANPLSDADLEEKFLDLAAPVVGQRGAADLARTCWAVEELTDVTTLLAAATGPR
jgi:2-methylcitrate dehydratase PrpD